MYTIIPIPPNKIQRQDSAQDQMKTVVDYIHQFCLLDDLRNEVKRMIAERLGCYDAADMFFPKRNDYPNAK